MTMTLMDFSIETVDVEYADCTVNGFALVWRNADVAIVGGFGYELEIRQIGAHGVETELEPTRDRQLAIALDLGENCFGPDTNDTADGIYFEHSILPPEEMS